MTKEAKFFIYLLERYADYKHVTTAEVLKQWDQLELTEFIFSMYDLYHIERLENAFKDIDELIKDRLN